MEVSANDQSVQDGGVSEGPLFVLAVAIYAPIELGKATWRGGKYLTKAIFSESFSYLGSSGRESWKGVRQIPEGIGSVAELPITITKQGLSEGGSYIFPSAKRAGKDVWSVGATGAHLAQAGLYPVSAAVQELFTYGRSGVQEGVEITGAVIKGPGLVLLQGLEIIYLYVREGISYLPAGVYESRRLASSLADLVLEIVGQGTVKKILAENASYLSGAGYEAAKAPPQIVAGGRGVWLETRDLIQVLLEESGSYLVSGGGEAVKGAKEVPALIWSLTAPMLGVLKECTRESINYLRAGRDEAAKGVEQVPAGLDAGTYMPRQLLRAVVMEILGFSLSSLFELWKGARNGAGIAWDGTEVPREFVSSLAEETYAHLHSGGGEVGKGIREGVTGLGQILEVPKEVVEEVLLESLAYLRSEVGEVLKLRDFVRGDAALTYDGLVRYPVEIWYYDNRNKIQHSYREFRDATSARWAQVQEWWEQRGARELT